MSSIENQPLEPQSTTHSTSIESELIRKFRHQNELLKSKLLALDSTHQQKKQNFLEYLQINKARRESHLRKLDMYRQRQELGEQKMQEMTYLTQLLRLRATQLGIECDSEEDGSDDVFNDDGERSEE